MEERMMWWNIIKASFVGADLHIKLKVSVVIE